MAEVSYAGIVENIFARRDRKREFEKAHRVEQRKVSVAERRQTQAESMADVTKRYQTAQTDYMNMLKDKEMKSGLNQARTALINEQLLTSTTERETALDRITSIKKGMESSDEATRTLARDTYWGAKAAGGAHDMIDGLRLQNQQLETAFKMFQGTVANEMREKDFALKASGHMIEWYDHLLDMGISKDVIARRVQAAEERAGFGGDAKRHVGEVKVSPIGAFGAGGAITSPAQMSLEDAIKGVQAGDVAPEDFINAYPSHAWMLEMIEMTGEKAPESPIPGTQAPANASFEQDLIKRLQQ